MKKLLQIALFLAIAIGFVACDTQPKQAESENEFKGKIAKSYADSEEWWPEKMYHLKVLLMC